MALRAVPDHPKFATLKRLLKLGKAATLGYLECSWHFTGRFTPRGDIGKYSDADIESWLEWPGEPGALIAALVESRWLDRDDAHRLLVHDWAHHADDATRQSLKRKKLDFCSRSVPTVSRQSSDTIATVMPNNATVSGLPEPVPEPVPVPEPEPEPEPEPVPGSEPVPEPAPAGASKISSDRFLARIDPSVVAMIAELEHIYALAGAPIAEKHKQLAAQLLLSITPEKRQRVPNYCKWALAMGKWPDPAKTKSLINVLRDGDFDVELTPRVLPIPRVPSARQSTLDAAEERFLKGTR